jgi:hypothetical protein
VRRRIRRDGKCRELVLCLDKRLGSAVCGIDEVNVFGRAPRRVDGEHGEGMFENLRECVDGVFLEEDELAGADFVRWIVGNGDLCGSGENVEVLVAAGVEVCRDGAVDAKDTTACGLLVGEADVGEHGFGGGGERFGKVGDVEEAVFGWHIDE